MKNIFNCTGATTSFPAIKVVAGNLASMFIDNDTAVTVEDNSNNLAGSAVAVHNFGLRVQAPQSNTGTKRSDNIPNGGALLCAPVCLYGNGAATPDAMLALHPSLGLMFNGGANPGYESALSRITLNTLDVQFPKAVAPTGLSATAASGGTLANGTYYYSINACTNNNCSGSNTVSAGSNEVSVILSGSNGTVNLSWNPPAGTAPVGCAIYRATVPTGTYASTTIVAVVPNCTTTTTLSDTNLSIGSGSNPLFNATFASFYHFAPSSANPAGGTVPYFAGLPSSGDCVKWGAGGLLQDAGAACSGAASASYFAPSPNQAGSSAAPSAANAINVVEFYLPTQVVFSKLTIDIGTADTTAGSLCGGFADCYDAGIYDSGGNLKCNYGASAFNTSGVKDTACAQGSVTLAAGYYIFAFTGNATTAKIFFGGAGGGGFGLLSSATSATTSTNGALPATISVPSIGPNVTSTYANVFIALH